MERQQEGLHCALVVADHLNCFSTYIHIYVVGHRNTVLTHLDGFHAWTMGLMALLGQTWEGPGQGVPSSEPFLWVPAGLWDSLQSWA